jgi:two-component system NtrC family sensor kinase
MSAAIVQSVVPGRAVPSRFAMPSLGVWMIVALVVVALLAYWDAARESTAALGEFADEQSAIAEGIAAALTARLGSSDAPDALRRLHAVERPGSMILLFEREGANDWTTTDGRVVHVPGIDSARLSHERWIRLSREQSADLGLPQRTSIAGFAPLDAGALGRWTIAVVTSARRERDRELRAQWRLVLGVVMAAGLVLVFGGIALRKQRTELELARELAVSEVQRQRDERLVRADKLATMGALATGIAHEVSTPLGVILGRAEQLMPKVQHDERAKRGVEAILEQGERISRVIRGFLSLARGDSPPFDHVDPATIATKSVDLVEHRFTKAGVALRTDVEGALPSIACEPRLLEQALANLLLNACDACDEGGHVELQVRVEGQRVAFVVSDDGVGIDPSISASIVEPFFTTKPSGKGTGLGLAIAKEIVSHHNGTLSIASKETPGSRGTRACIEVPTIAKGTS